MNRDPSFAGQCRRGSALGVLITLILVAGLIGLGAYLVMKPGSGHAPAPTSGTPTTGTSTGTASTPAVAPPAGPAVVAPEGKRPDPIEPAMAVPRLDAAAPYVPKNGILDVDISEYAGYAGLIVANKGLDPNPDSFFAKEYGFQVRLTLSEGENWSRVNHGQLAAGATTTDVLAVLGRQYAVNVPLLISYSRGADMIVVDQGLTSVNQLAGKVLAAAQFNESEFFIRYLAQEAGVGVQVLRDLDARPTGKNIGLVFYADAFIAADAYQHELASGKNRLNGCVGWSPRTDELVAASNGRAKILVSNRNLLVVADILTINQGFAQANPKMTQGLVHGILEGNRQVRADPKPFTTLLAKTLKWKEDEVPGELAKVHLANLPENLAFFNGTIDAAGSFGGIFQSALTAYGPQLIPNPADADRFHTGTVLDALKAGGTFAQETVAIAPIRTVSKGSALEGDALLAKDIRFLFEANSSTLDLASPDNQEYLATINRYLTVSPGSQVLLKGHVDNSLMAKFRQEGGETLVRNMALKAVELSKERAKSVRQALLNKYPGMKGDRLECIGRGWEEPVSALGDQNRRVEVRWFTLE